MWLKLKNRSGKALIIILLISIVVICCILFIGIPLYHAYEEQSDEIGCMSAMDTAENWLAINYLTADLDMTALEAKDSVAYTMNGFSDICPGGGSMYLIEQEGDVPYKVVCGLHEDDLYLKTRLNAANCLRQLKSKWTTEHRKGNKLTGTLDATINSETVEVKKVTEKVNFKRGTSTTKGYEDEEMVAFYMLDEDGEITWFTYADTDHYAVWTAKDGWTGDSFSQK